MDDACEKFNVWFDWLKEQFKRPANCSEKHNKLATPAPCEKKMEPEPAKECEPVKLPCCELKESLKDVDPKDNPDSVNPKCILKVEEYHCMIKMQDPYEEFDCPTSNKIVFPPCPPKTYLQNPRDSACGCDMCTDDGSMRKCCQSKKTPIDINKKVGTLEHV